MNEDIGIQVRVVCKVEPGFRNDEHIVLRLPRQTQSQLAANDFMAAPLR